MPRTKIRCVVDNAEVEDTVCLACKAGTPRAGQPCHFSYEMLKGMMDRSGRENAHISSTMVAAPCLRRVRLEQEVEYAASPATLFRAFTGTLGHHLTERWPEPGCLYEERFELPLTLKSGQQVIFTGQIDKLCLTRRMITDFKTKREVSDEGKPVPLPAKPSSSHRFQLNLHRLLVKEGWPQREITHDALGEPLAHPLLPGVPAGIEIKELELCYWNFERSSPIPVPLMRNVKHRLLQRLEVLTAAGIPEIPKELDPYVSRLCVRWCPVRAACLTHLDHQIGF